MVKNYKMISFTGCDGSGKSTIIKELQKFDPYKQLLYVHYYHIIFKVRGILGRNKVIRNQNIKELQHSKKSLFSLYIILIYEAIYSILLLFYLIYKVKIIKSGIILDRTFIDVFYDLKSKHGNKKILLWFKLLNIIFFKIFKLENNILLTTNSYHTNYDRKKDEPIEIFKQKFDDYSKLNTYNYFVINTEENNINQIVGIIKQ